MAKSLKELIREEYIKCAKDPVYFFKKYCYSLKNWDLVHHGGEAEEEVVEASVGISGMFRACRLMAPLRVNAQLRLLAA